MGLEPVSRVRRVLVSGLDDCQLRTPSLEPRGEGRRSLGREEIRLDPRSDDAQWHARGLDDGLNPRDMPAVLGSDRSHADADLGTEQPVLERPAQLTAPDVAEVAAA